MIYSNYDYDPFGSLIPNRHGLSTAYRYGFQGQEKDDEIKGEGNSLNYTYRMHDPRIGRFFAVDPLTRKYPMLTPYQFSSNMPIHAPEFEGLETSKDLNGKVEANIKKDNENTDVNVYEPAHKALEILENVKDAIDNGNMLGLNNASTALTKYMNGDGGILYLEPKDFISRYAYSTSQKEAKILDEAKKLGEKLKEGESITYKQTYATSITGALDDFYYTSGTGFIRTAGVINVTKSKGGNINMTGNFYNTFIDTYDWHNGLGTSAGTYIMGLNDADMNIMAEYGAKEFGMRSYWISTVKAVSPSIFGYNPFGFVTQKTVDFNNVKTTQHNDKHDGYEGTLGKH